MRRTTHTIILAAALLLSAASALAQDRGIRGDHSSRTGNSSNAIGLFHDYTDGMGHQALTIVTINGLPDPLRFSSVRRFERALMLALGSGMRFAPDGSRRLVWKGTFLDFDRTSRETPDEWETLPYLRVALDSFSLHPSFTYGLTVLDYDRTTAADLDARWLHGRIGFGIEMRMVRHLALLSDIRGHIGFTSLVPGSAGYGALGFDDTTMISGVEGGVRGSVSLRYAFDTRELLVVSMDAGLRRFTADTSLRLGGLSATLRYVGMNYPETFFKGEVYVMVSQQTSAYSGRQHVINSIHSGILFRL